MTPISKQICNHFLSFSCIHNFPNYCFAKYKQSCLKAVINKIFYSPSTHFHWTQQDIWAVKSSDPRKKVAFGNVIFFVFKNISTFWFFFLYVMKENSTCAPASWSVLSISTMLCAAVVKGCCGNSLLYFLGGPAAFGLHILCVECNFQKTGRWGGWGYKVQVEQLIFRV